MNRYHAHRAARRSSATGFVSQPEPRTIGRIAKGRQLCSGNFLFAGHLVEAPDTEIWAIEMPDRAFEDEVQGFTWLDDLAAVGDPLAQERAQAWLRGWIERYGRGRGPGWTPDLTGRRLIRWINHAIFLVQSQESEVSEGFYRSLSQQTIFLGKRWHSASPGLPRFEALTGLVYAGLSLLGMEELVEPAVNALAQECEDQIDAQGGLPTRCPEELLEVFTLLNWAASALSEAGRITPRAHLDAIERIAPTLRLVRHADGGLARFHGGGRGIEGRLDQALASSGVRPAPPPDMAMGFARLSAGRTTLICDVSAPPKGAASANAHASTLAIEVTSGRRPLVVNCGSGRPFGEDWRRVGRATASHSTLSIEGFSSSRISGDGELLTETPKDVRIRQSADSDSVGLIAGHDGYVRTHGLTHVRSIDMSTNARGLAAEDTLATVSEADKKRFDRAMNRVKLQGIPFQIRFHLHPDVDAELDMNGAAVSLALKSGEVWVFRHDRVAEMSLERSVFLEKGRIKPRATKQIVLSARAMQYATRIRWTLAKATDTPSHIRDLERDDSEMMM